MDILRMTSGDADPLQGQVADRNGPVDLSAATVTLHGRASGGRVFELTCTPFEDQDEDADRGWFETSSPVAIESGEYRIGLEVVIGEDVNWFPSGPWERMSVKAALPQVE